MLTFQSGFLLSDLSMRFVVTNRIWYKVSSSKNFQSNFEKRQIESDPDSRILDFGPEKSLKEYHVLDLIRKCNLVHSISFRNKPKFQFRNEPKSRNCNFGPF